MLLVNRATVSTVAKPTQGTRRDAHRVVPHAKSLMYKVKAPVAVLAAKLTSGLAEKFLAVEGHCNIPQISAQHKTLLRMRSISELFGDTIFINELAV